MQTCTQSKMSRQHILACIQANCLAFLLGHIFTDQDLSKKGCALQKRTAHQLSSRTAQNHMNQAEAVASTKAHNE